MIKVYGNKQQTFECKVEIEGAEYSSVRPRLIFSPVNENKHLFIEGKVEHGVCKVVIPGGLQIAHSGNVVLEVLVDNTMFSPWKSTYEMVVESVKAEAVEIKKNDGSVRIVEAKVESKKPTVTVAVKKKPSGFIKEGVSAEDRRRVEEAVAAYKKLKEDDKKLLKERILPTHKPTASAKSWAKSVFNETTSLVPKICMYAYEEPKTGKKK